MQLELEIAEGLEAIALAEAERKLGSHIRSSSVNQGAIQCEYKGDLERLKQLKTVNAAYIVLDFPIPRPKALLGHEYWKVIVAQLQLVLQAERSLRTFHLSAAGSDSNVMQRIRAEISSTTDLQDDPQQGDLLLRLRSNGHGGWQLLIRTTPRPLATRAWRTHNMEGALNASVAHAMALLSRPMPDDIVVNLGCGSGTLLIERAEAGSVKHLIGLDSTKQVLGFAVNHLAQAKQSASLLWADVAQCPLPSACASVLLADLPFGQLVGSQSEIEALYPLLFSEAARIAMPNARFILISHAIRLMEKTLAEQSKFWGLTQTLKVTLGGLHPRIYCLQRH